MKFSLAYSYARALVVSLNRFCERIVIVGSVRRRRPEVHDVDLVLIPKVLKSPEQLAASADGGWDLIYKHLCKHKLTPIKKGPKLMSLLFPDVELPVDIYRATSETWGILLLVRTGSKEHNVKLCSLAKSKGLKLSAAEGVITKNGSGEVIACRTEEEIFTALGLDYVQPQDREVCEA